jgi:D-alanyl-D-alanine carboxypeptidase/D-alanyl-D-alanine-endopeptidase (penicillin-binding protein 4)
MRRSHAAIGFVWLLLQVVGFAADQPAKKDLAKQIQAIIRQPGFSRAHWGIDVVDLETGKAIFALNPDHLFLPASNAKLLATSAALALAGPEYRFHTTIETTGKIDTNGRLLGDLVIVGRGDPNISGRVMPYQLKTERISPHTQILEQLADQIVQKGVKIVDGDLIGDDSYYAAERYGEGWAHDDLQWIDGAPVSALTFNDNILFVKIQPAEKAGDKALVTVDPPTNYYELDNRILTTAAGIARKVGIHREPGSYKVVLWGAMPLDDAGMNEAIAIEDPAEFTAQVFRALLEARGITITGKTRARHGELAQFFDQPQPPTPVLAAPSGPPAQILAERVSLPLIEDVRVTNKTSQNLHAELDLRLIGQLKGIGGSFEGGAATLKQFLLQAGLTANEFFVLDGSGLSRRDLITPGAMGHLLLYAARQPWGAAFEQTLPVAGVDGSLAERFVNTPAGGLVHAKTGTLSHVNTLSGYGQTRSGKRFVFSIFCNNHDLPSAKVVAAIDAIMVLVVTGGESVQKAPEQ